MVEKNAENLMFEKEIEYTRGFLDALQLIRSNANPIIMHVPESKRLDALMAAIDWLHIEATEKHSENTRIFFFDNWNLESWMKQEGITPEKFQSDEKHEAKPQSIAPTLNEEKPENTSEGKLETPFGYEQVTVNVPKPVMDLLQFSESVIEQTPAEFAEMAIVKTVRAMVDSGEFLPDAKAIADKFKLNPVFQEIIDDPVT